MKIYPRLACAIDVRPHAPRAMAGAHANAMDIANARIQAEEIIRTKAVHGITKCGEMW